METVIEAIKQVVVGQGQKYFGFQVGVFAYGTVYEMACIRILLLELGYDCGRFKLEFDAAVQISVNPVYEFPQFYCPSILRATLQFP